MSLCVDFTQHNLKIKLNDKDILFNKNILYCLNLNSKEFTVIDNLIKLEKVYDLEKYFIFTWNFIGNTNILKNLSSKFNLNFIEYSVKCFWCLIVLDNEYTEKININFKKFNINYSNKENLANQVNISKNIYNEVERLNEKIDNYKKSILNESVEKILLKKNDINKRFDKVEGFLKNLNINIEAISTLKDKEMVNLVEQKEILLNDIRYLQREEKKNKQLVNLAKLEYFKKKEEYQNLILDEQKMLEEIKLKIEEIKEINHDKLLMSNFTLSTTIEKRPLAIMVHLFKINLWENISEFIQNLEEFNLDIDLYVNISVNDKQELSKPDYTILKDKIKKTKLFKNIYFTDSDNRGMDIGGFFISCCKMYDLGLRYDSIIKIHSKTNDSWRFAMLYALLGNEKIIKNNLKLLANKTIGMIGNNVLSINNVLSVNLRSYKYIYTYMDYFKIQKKTNLGHFVPGTIFWLKGDVLEKHFTKKILLKCYYEFEQNYCGSMVNNREGKPHAFERFFGIMVNNCGLETVPFDHKV